MKPAMRISGQRSLRQPFAMAQQKLLVIFSILMYPQLTRQIVGIGWKVACECRL